MLSRNRICMLNHSHFLCLSLVRACVCVFLDSSFLSLIILFVASLQLTLVRVYV